MRLDRFIALHLIRRFRSVVSKSPGDQKSLPILMYHSISDEPETVSSYYKVNTSPAGFRRQMTHLQKHGFKGVTLGEGLSWLNSDALRSPVPASKSDSSVASQPVAITFDDGFRNFYTEAVPVLRDTGFSATMFLPTAFIGETRRRFTPAGYGSTPNPHPSISAHRECLTWSEVRELHQEGFEFGSHTVNHPKLVDLDWPAIESELRDSKAAIDLELKTSTRTFAYPYAFPQASRAFVARFRDLLVETGYESCVTTAIGTFRPGNDCLTAARLPANTDDDDALLQAKLNGDYDWLGLPQAAAKRIKHVCRI